MHHFDFLRFHHGGDFGGRITPAGMLLHDLALAVARWISHANAQHEPVELRFRQWIGSVVFDGVLRGQHHERRGKLVSVIVHCYLGFVHGFQQRRLRLGRGAINFVRQDDVGKDRAGLEIKALLDLIENAGAHDVRGKQVRGELDPLERAVEGIRESLREGRLAHPGHVLDQQMAFGQQGHKREADHFVLAANHAPNRCLQLSNLVCRRRGHLVENPYRFCYKRSVPCGRLAQLVRALPSHGRGQRFESFIAHHSRTSMLPFFPRLS